MIAIVTTSALTGQAPPGLPLTEGDQRCLSESAKKATGIMRG